MGKFEYFNFLFANVPMVCVCVCLCVCILGVPICAREREIEIEILSFGESTIKNNSIRFQRMNVPICAYDNETTHDCEKENTFKGRK